MNLKIIFGWLPVKESNKLRVLAEYSLLALYDFSYSKALQGLEAEGLEYFRTYNPLFVDCLTNEEVLENVVIWDGEKLKKFKDFPELLRYSPHVPAGELVAAEDFSKNWGEK